jgi:D-inositol-3-phosphate glycosyltransferase
VESNNLVFNNKIALIEPSGGYSGMQYYNIGISKGLHFNGVEVFLFTASSEKFSNLHCCKFYSYFDKVWSSQIKVIKLFHYFVGLFKSIFTAKNNKCKIVHLHQFHLNLNLIFTITICNLFFKKIFLTVHDVESFDSKTNKYNRFFVKLLNIFVDQFIVHNKFSSTELYKEIQVSPIIIKHGNYIPFFAPTAYNPSNKTFNLLFFGLIKESKGLDLLLKSLVSLKKKGFDFRLTIAGRPWRNDFSIYKKIIDDNNLSSNVVAHLHFISEFDLLNLFNCCDLVVLPYRKIFQSGVILKSMSLKRAVLCSNITAFQEQILDTINGFIFESENIESLTSKLMLIMNHKESLVSVSEAAYNDIEKNYDWRDIGFELKNLYKRIYEN